MIKEICLCHDKNILMACSVKDPVMFLSYDESIFFERSWLCNRNMAITQFVQSLVDQRTDNQQMKAKLRRLEEDTARREKQIEELLDPTKVGLVVIIKGFTRCRNHP